MTRVKVVPVLTAPTAAGKSALALRLAEHEPVEIVSADAFTVYRGLDIGTAKPTRDQRARVPHHLIDVVDVIDRYDVARFVREAEAAIADISGRGRVPLVVGGTGFYLSALLRGLPLTPPADPLTRAVVEEELQQRGLEALLAEIAAADPAEERRMERNPRRVVRAVELLRRTGKLPGHFGRSVPRFQYALTAFTHPPEELERRITQRVGEMLRAGWSQEAAWLADQVNPDRQPQAGVWQALGYREALAVQRGTLEHQEAARRIGLATRQYAKRQLTFLRTQLGADWLSPQQAAGQLASRVSQWVSAGI